MNTQKLIHDIPFVIEAARRQTQRIPATPLGKIVILDEMHFLMSGVKVMAEVYRSMPRVRHLSLTTK